MTQASDSGKPVELAHELARLTDGDPHIDNAGAEQLWEALTGLSADDWPDACDTFTSALAGELDDTLRLRPGG